MACKIVRQLQMKQKFYQNILFFLSDKLIDFIENGIFFDV